MSRPGALVATLSMLAMYLATDAWRMLCGCYAPTWVILGCGWVFMLGLAWEFRTYWPLWFVGGAALNRVVMWANDGRMPVVSLTATPPWTPYLHVEATERSRLVFFADWIPMWHGAEASLGDLFIVNGLLGTTLVIIYRVLVDAHRRAADRRASAPDPSAPRNPHRESVS